MAKTTMREELEMLRSEVEALKRQQQTPQTEPAATTDVEELIRGKLEQAEEKAAELSDEVKEQLEELLESLKNEYDKLSPMAAVALFALGVVFGRIISSR